MKKLIFLVLLVSFFGGIMMAQKTILIDFKYSRLTVETTQTADGKIERKTIDFGQNDFDLQLRDLIEFYLQGKNYTVTNKSKKDADYTVKFHVVNLYASMYSIEVEIYDNKETLVNRRLITAYSMEAQKTLLGASELISKYVMEVIKP